MFEGVLRHDEVQPAQRLDERELDADLENFPHGDVVGCVRFIGYSVEVSKRIDYSPSLTFTRKLARNFARKTA